MLERIEEEAARHSEAVCAAQVRVGVLSGVDCEALRFPWEIAREGTSLAGVRLEIESVPVVAHCRGCGLTHRPAVQSLECPRCRTPPQEILAGRELELTSVELKA